MDAEFEGIPELANLSDNSELLAHLYFRQTHNHTAERQHQEGVVPEHNGPNNKDLEQLYLNHLGGNAQIKRNETVNTQIPGSHLMHTDHTGNSYDNAVREFKWLHEVNQERLDNVLEDNDLKTPAATHN